mmetsp:Transcript_12949/g.19794  ORF Transcript_12949/g.19794 Transcript_12949/m.19794 type:complete len:345 (+) Transcript_12949:394-1428(+)|eukprot:CAMPEP_0178914364 /NCGR_PEP_ID=MMETSP0786-20121207/11385_1 /TAXON_ID=186022 /ORGANISM="Thalassionema frauenfeldii, Strain CCMP 1798" /LENGTH=344 /DNA_ID=CAMNT_0020587265 /DNA_START=147 /DNA_END=1181 /DNA_ORIENTATION=-
MKLQIALATLLSTISQVRAQYDTSIPSPVCAKFKTIKMEGSAKFVDTDNSVEGGVITSSGQTAGDMTISVDLTGTAAVGSYPTQTSFRNISLDMSAICIITQDQSQTLSAPTCFWEANLGFCRSWRLRPKPFKPIERVKVSETLNGGGRRTRYLRESNNETFEEELVEATNVTEELIIDNPEIKNICPQLGCRIRTCRDQRNGGFTAHGTGPDKFEITGGTDGLFGAFGQFEGEFAFPTNSGFLTLIADGKECGAQHKNLGTSFSSPEECAVAATNEPGCGSSFMYSDNYGYAWGCRCCTHDGAAGGGANNNWDLYSFDPSGDINLDIDVDLEICYYEREHIFT